MNPLIIGSRDDSHVRAVIDALLVKPAVIDAQTLQDTHFDFAPPEIRIRTPEWTLQVEKGTRGWIRRLSPMSWEVGTVIGSHGAADKASWLALLASLLRHPDIHWLTPVDSMVAAENKLTQYTLASRIGISAPKTRVSNSRESFDAVERELVAKPLGPGHFQDRDGRWLTVFTDIFDPNSEDHKLLSGPPFIVQERLRPTSHLRVVTVLNEAWIFRRSAEGLPIDWREVDRGHREWERVHDVRVGDKAIALARAHGLGYSSQDWIDSGDDIYFLDLNPGGQWLFLPSFEANKITISIASWLSGSWH